ncbi:MAG TPA: hypothetical protein VGN23_09050 [Verrucomicrobiae bacterium]|jgi:hypothetical protein
MKKLLPILVVAALATGILPSHAQTEGISAPEFSGGTDILFGDNQSFSADVQIQLNGTPIKLHCKKYFNKSSLRTELDLSQAQGYMSPQALAQAKSIGLDKIVSIYQAGSHVLDMVYPDAQAYAEMTVPTPSAIGTNAESVALTPLGNETVAGHPCVKNKAIVTDNQGIKQEFTVWNATDLKNFPVQIIQNDGNDPSTETFSNINFSKPDPSLFVPPSGFKKYNDPNEIIRAVTKKRGGTTPLPQQ